MSAGKCWLCRPAVYERQGGEHTGIDAFLRCVRCGHENGIHVECNQVTRHVRGALLKNWYLPGGPPNDH